MNDIITFIKRKKIGTIKTNINLSNYTTYKVGGNAKVLVYHKNIIKLIELLKEIKSKNIKYKILGNGSNLIFSDKEFDGILIKLDNIKSLYIQYDKEFDN